MALTDVRVLDSITQPDGGHSGDGAGYSGVVIAASHGGRYAGYLAARLGVRGVILNDAGVGKDDAGIGGLAYLDDLDCPAATVDHDSARIGDGLDCARNGRITHVNDAAEALGCRVGESALDCADRMRDAEVSGFAESGSDASDSAPEYETARFGIEDGDPPVWGMDSLSLIGSQDAGRIAVTGSHGARLAGETETYIPTPVAGAVFNDAGGGKDDAGVSRLPVLADRGIPAATVAADSARIGSARSTWEDGRLSAVNRVASDLGVAPGDSCPEFVAGVRESWE